MKKWMKRFITAGMGICLSASLMAGCGNKEEKTEEEKVQTEQSETEVKEEVRPEKQAAEHPAFVPDGIRRVVLVRDGEEIFHLSNEPADYKMDFDYWEILNPYDETVTVNTEEMYNLLGVLCQFNFQTPVEVEEGVDTGIQNSTTGFTVDFVNTVDAVVAKQTKYADATAEIILGNEDGMGNFYAAVKGKEDQIYKLSKMILSDIYAVKPFDYILKIPVLIHADTVESMEITAGKKTYELQVDSAKGEYKFGKKKVEKEEFIALYQEIASIILDSEIEEVKESKEEKLSIVYHRNTKDAPEITVTYYSYDDSFDSVEINGKERFLVKTEDVDKLIESIKKAF